MKKVFCGILCGLLWGGVMLMLKSIISGTSRVATVKSMNKTILLK